eukprot:1285831-Rhodomonas_salina.1
MLAAAAIAKHLNHVMPLPHSTRRGTESEPESASESPQAPPPSTVKRAGEGGTRRGMMIETEESAVLL